MLLHYYEFLQYKCVLIFYHLDSRTVNVLIHNDTPNAIFIKFSPLHEQDVTLDQSFKWIFTGLNSKFSFS